MKLIKRIRLKEFVSSVKAMRMNRQASKRDCLVASFITLILAIGVFGAAQDESPIRGRSEMLSTEGVSLVFAGDALFGRSFSENQDPKLKELFEIFQQADASFINLEQVMSNKGSGDPDHSRLVRANPELLSEIQWAGVDAVSLANNHSMNYGPEGLLGTISELDRLGIQHAGGGANIQEAQAAAVIQVSGLKVGLLSLYSGSSSTSTASMEIAGKARPGMFLLRASQVNIGGERIVAPVAADLETMINTIQRTRPTVDILAVSIHMHWGKTFQEEFPSYQRMVARSAIDAGADLFVVHGPHVPRGIEAYRNGFIAYSIGNLFWNLKDLGINPNSNPLYMLDEAFQSILVRAIVLDGEIRRLEILPIYMYPKGDYQGIPHLPDEVKNREILDRVKRLSADLNTKLTIESWYGVIESSR